MSIRASTRKKLWARSGNICAYPNCGQVLVVDLSETDNISVVGEEAHIVAKEPNGPRGDSPLSIEERDDYNNLIRESRVG